MNYKKPTLGFIALMFALFLSMGFCFLTNPMTIYAMTDGTMTAGSFSKDDDLVYGVMDTEDPQHHCLMCKDIQIPSFENTFYVCWKENCQHDSEECMAWYGEKTILIGREDSTVFLMDYEPYTSKFSVWKVDWYQKQKEEVYNSSVEEILNVQKVHSLSINLAMTDGKELYIQVRNPRDHQTGNQVIQIDMESGDYRSLIQVGEEKGLPINQTLFTLGMVNGQIYYYQYKEFGNHEFNAVLKRYDLARDESEEMLTAKQIILFENTYLIYSNPADQDLLTITLLDPISGDEKALGAVNQSAFLVPSIGFTEFNSYDGYVGSIGNPREHELVIINEDGEHNLAYMNVETGEKRYESAIHAPSKYEWVEYHEEKTEYNPDLPPSDRTSVMIEVHGQSEDQSWQEDGLWHYPMNSESQLLVQLEKPGVRSTDDYLFCFDEAKTTMKIGQIDYDSQKDATQITMSFSIKPGEEDTVEIRYAREGEVLSHFKLIGISEETTGTP